MQTPLSLLMNRHADLPPLSCSLMNRLHADRGGHGRSDTHGIGLSWGRSLVLLSSSHGVGLWQFCLPLSLSQMLSDESPRRWRVMMNGAMLNGVMMTDE